MNVYVLLQIFIMYVLPVLIFIFLIYFLYRAIKKKKPIGILIILLIIGCYFFGIYSAVNYIKELRASVNMNNIYEMAGNPEIITEIHASYVAGGTDLTITSKEDIQDFCEIVNKMEFINAENLPGIPSYIVTFQIYNTINEYYYTLTVPDGRMIRAVPGKVISPRYIIKDYDEIVQWEKDIREKYTGN